jgi:twinkle protein
MSPRDFARSNRITDAELRNYEPAAPEDYIKSCAEYDVDVIASMRKTGLEGDSLPWVKTQQNFRLRMGDVTLWHGINGHGKSAITTQVALWLALQGKKCCLASFEMPPLRTLERMVKQCAGNPTPSDKFIGEFFISLCSSLWIYDHQGRVDPQMLFKAIRYCREKKGITHFFVDSLMKCVPREDDYGLQADFVSSLCDVAREADIHIHLIHHTRKTGDESKPPGKFDAKGTGGITDQVSNVLAMWRNKAKEREKEEAARMGQALANEAPDFLLICDKQRNGTWEGNWALWGDPQSWHFREQSQTGWTRGYELPGYTPKEAA